MRRLGVGAESLCAAHPDLIYLSLPGFVSRDADLASVPAWEAVITVVMPLGTLAGTCDPRSCGRATARPTSKATPSA
ncbi:MAG: hypothetical protein ACE5GC_07540 [Acidimicrobiia bacterium]